MPRTPRCATSAASWRDTRDARVLDETLADVARRAGVSEPPSVGRELAAVAFAGRDVSRGARRLLRGEISVGLIAARRRARNWTFERTGFALISLGLRRAYADLQGAEALAAEHATAVHFHEWRKQAKYHANQMLLLQSVAPPIFKGYRKIGDRLAATLGIHHDQDVLLGAIRKADGQLERDSGPLLAVIASRNAALETKAFRLGHELTAERPSDFLRRIETGWHAWRHP